jgi:hypothetical protein
MSNDIQTQVTAQTGQSVAALNQVTSAMDRLANKTKAASKEAQDLQKKVNGTFKEAGAGIAKAGGPLGSVGSRLLGGIGMGGPLGVASVGLVAVTTALNALSAASNRAVEAVGKVIEYEEKNRAAREKGAKEEQAQAEKGAAQEGAVRPLIAKGGAVAERELVRLERKGIDTTTAARGLERIATRFPGQPLDSGAGKNAIDQALNLASLGMRFDEAIEKLLARGGLNTFDSSMRSGDLVYKEFTGQRGDPAEIRAEAIKNVARSTYLTDVEKKRQIEGQIPETQRNRSGDLELAARENLAAAVAPMAKALLEANVLAQRQIDAMQRQADAQNILMRWITTSGRAFGLSAGSEQQKVNAEIEARANALFNPER